MRCLLFLWSGAALSRLDVGFFILRGCLNKNKASLFYVFLLYSANINRGFRRGFLRTENRKRILPHKRTDFVTFALRRSDCSLAGSFLSEAVLSGRTERLTQGNKTVLLCGKIPFLFSSVCQIPFRLFFRKNRLFFLKIPSLETACAQKSPAQYKLATWYLQDTAFSKR